MRTKLIDDAGDLSIGLDAVTVRLPGQRAVTVATILYRENRPDGEPCYLVLDRVVHQPNHPRGHILGNWEATGAVTTELRRDHKS